jgi:hypothetical protein
MRACRRLSARCIMVLPESGRISDRCDFTQPDSMKEIDAFF